METITTTIKLVYADDIRKLSLENLSVPVLQGVIKSLFTDLTNVPFENLFLYYLDDEMDKIRIKCDGDLLEAIRYSRSQSNRILKIFIQTSTPSDSSLPHTSVPSVPPGISGSANLAPLFNVLSTLTPMMSSVIQDPAAVQQITSMLPTMLPLFSSMLGNPSLRNSTVLPAPEPVNSHLEQHLQAHEQMLRQSTSPSSSPSPSTFTSTGPSITGFFPSSATQTQHAPSATQTTQTQHVSSSTQMTQTRPAQQTPIATQTAQVPIATQTTQTQPAITTQTTQTQPAITTQTTQTQPAPIATQTTQTQPAPITTQTTQTQPAQTEAQTPGGPLTSSSYDFLVGTRFGKLLDQLAELGFTDKEKCVRALVKCGGNIVEAVDELLLESLL